jgi:hypothetical protein
MYLYCFEEIEMQPNECDYQIAEELRKAYAHILAVWKILKPSDAGPYTLPTIFLSRDLLWKGQVTCNPSPDDVLSRKITSEDITLAIVSEHAMHVIPVADFHRKPRDKVREVWAERNIAIIKKIVQGSAIFVSDSDTILDFFVAGAQVEPYQEIRGQRIKRAERMTLASGVQILLWKPSEDRVRLCLTNLPAIDEQGAYDRMITTLREAVSDRKDTELMARMPPGAKFGSSQ